MLCERCRRAPSGEPLHPAVIQEELYRIANEAGIPRIGFLGLRHTQATVLANAGVAPQIIQRRLGHSRIGVTMDLYAHKTPGQDAPAAETLERILGDNPPGPVADWDAAAPPGPIKWPRACPG